MNQEYGIIRSQSSPSVEVDLSEAYESFEREGFCVFERVISPEIVNQYRQCLDRIEKIQTNEVGEDVLIALSELNTARLPLAYDLMFLELAKIPIVLKLLKHYLGDFFILNQQNGILTRPNHPHHQSSWHRDLPYQHWVCSQPLAISALIALDEFTEKSGATHLIPGSHRWSKFPSNTYIHNHELPIIVPSGSVVIFDSMVYHRAGINSADYIRRAVNHVYTIPLLQQQICIPLMLKDFVPEDQFTRRLLGYETQIANSVIDYRKNRLSKLES